MQTDHHAPLPDCFAVLADVHGNSAALAAVLADVDVSGAQALLVLGDHFSGPLDAGGTAALLLDRRSFALRGNHDRYLLETPRDQLAASDRVARDELSEAAMDWLAGQPQLLDFGDVWACHARPDRDDAYWTHAAGGDGQVHPLSLAHVGAHAAGLEARLLICAHTHLPLFWRLPTGHFLLNPGSVGCPAYDDDHPVPHVVETRSPHASWALVRRAGRAFDVTFRQVPYDAAPMAERARQHGRESWACAVETGRLPVWE